MSSKDTYDQAVANLASLEDDPQAVQARELSSMVQLKLGGRIEGVTFTALLRIRYRLQSWRQHLSDELEHGSLSPDKYIEEVNVALSDALRESRLVLGPDRFRAIFGDTGADTSGLIDRDTFLASNAKAVDVTSR